MHNLINSYFICSFCLPLQMGFIQINEDFIFIEPLNRTLAVTGHAHRVYRRKRSIEEKMSEKPPSQNQYCGVVTGNTIITMRSRNVANMFVGKVDGSCSRTLTES